VAPLGLNGADPGASVRTGPALWPDQGSGQAFFGCFGPGRPCKGYLQGGVVVPIRFRKEGRGGGNPPPIPRGDPWTPHLPRRDRWDGGQGMGYHKAEWPEPPTKVDEDA